MKRNAIIAIVSLLAFGQGAWAHEPTIEGLTYNLGYYEIPDASALNALATYVNEGNTCEGLTFKVTGNITFSQVGHTEITENTEKTEAWITLDGRKLSGKPTQRGMYINNGKKIIIK